MVLIIKFTTVEQRKNILLEYQKLLLWKGKTASCNK